MPMVIGVGLSWQLAKKELVGSSTTEVVNLAEGWNLEIPIRIQDRYACTLRPDRYAFRAGELIQQGIASHWDFGCRLSSGRYAQIVTPFVQVNKSNKELPTTGTSGAGSHQVTNFLNHPA